MARRKNDIPEGYTLAEDAGDAGPDGSGAAREITPLDRELCAFDRNDVGNAKRLIARHGADLLHVTDIGWHVWDGTRWNLDADGKLVMRRAQKTAKAMKAEADAAAEAAGPRRRSEARAAAWKFAIGAGNSGRLRSMIDQAAPRLSARLADMDGRPLKFNVANGTLALGDLPPGENDPETVGIERLPHDRSDRITLMAGTREAPVAWDPEARAPEFERFLAAIQPDADTRGFLQRWFGYCLTGLVDEQAMVLLHGGGRNGKSTLVDTLAHVFGDYARSLPIKSFLRDDRTTGGQATPDLARLPGARLVRSSEPEPGAQISEAMIKEITGGEPITARHLHQGFFEFAPQFKAVISFNNKPTVRGADDGIWRRLLLVPFTVRVDKPDLHLKERLKAEASGILNWLLAGYRQWRAAGLMVPDSVRAATDDYRADSDIVGEFLKIAVVADAQKAVSGAEFYNAFKAWCGKNGIDAPSGTWFGKRLSGRPGIRKVRVGTVRYEGIDLSSEVRGWMAEARHKPGLLDSSRGPPEPEAGDPGAGAG